MRRLTLFFLILFISISTVSALDFYVSSDSEIDTFRCMEVKKNILVYNQDSESVNIALAVDGNFAEFIKLSDINFEIAGNSAKNLTIFYAVPCSIKAGSYNLDIYAYGFEGYQSISQKINVHTPDVLFSESTDEDLSKIITPCDTAEYNIVLKNPAGYDEEYELSVNSIDFKESEFSYEQFFSIPAYSEKSIKIKVSPDNCRMHGSFMIDIIAHANYMDLKKKFPLVLNISGKGIPEIIPEFEKIRTDFYENELEININQLGKESTKYNILVDGPSWVRTDVDSLIVEPDQNVPLKLLFNPNNSTEEKEYPVSIKFVVADTGVSYDYDFIVRLKRFSFFERNPYLLWVPLTLIIFIAALITGYVFVSRTKKYKVWIKKYKKTLKERKAKALAKKKKDVEKKKKRAEEKKKKIEELKKKLQEKKRKSAEKKEKKRQAYLKRLEERHNKKLEKKEKIDSKKKVKSDVKVNLKVVQKRKQIRVNENKGRFPWFIVYIIFALVLIGLFRIVGLAIILIFVILSLFNQFKKTKVFFRKWKFLEKDFSLPIETRWKTGIFYANMIALKNLEKFTLTIRKFRQKLADYKVFGCFDISVNDENSVKFTDVKFRINKRWFKKNNIEVDDFRLLKRTKDRWLSQKIEFIRSDKNFFYFSAERLVAGEFIFAGKPLLKEKKQRKGINIFWIAVIGIVALFVAQPLLSFEGIPEQVIAKDSQHKIDLKSYFYDPDFDSLSFSAEQTEHIDIVFDRGIAILTPESGWTGTEYTKFFAVDSGGSTASSNQVKVVVKDSILFDKNVITWTNMIILALLIFLVLIILFEKKPKQKQE